MQIRSWVFIEKYVHTCMLSFQCFHQFNSNASAQLAEICASETFLANVIIALFEFAVFKSGGSI